MVSEPLISIVVPTFNSHLYFSDCLQSVLAQSYKNWEMLVVDDGSEPSCSQEIERLVNSDKRIKFIQLSRHQGAAVARNAALDLAQGEYVAFLDSDDRWLSNKLESQLSFMLEEQAVFTFTAYVMMDEKLEKEIIRFEVPEKVSYSDILIGNPISCPTVMYKRDCFASVRMPYITRRQDFGFFLDLLKKCGAAYGVNEILTQVRIRQDSLSYNKWFAARDQWKIYRIHEKFSLYKACWLMFRYTLKGLKKYRYRFVKKVFSR